MRVLHVYSGNLFGGIESMLVTIARERERCRSMEHEFALAFDGRLSSELREAAVAVHALPPARLSRPLTVRRAGAALRRLVSDRRIDRVICHAAWSQAIFGRVVRRSGVALVFWAHDVLSGGPWTERRARGIPPDLAIANSRFTAETLTSLYPHTPSVVVHPPVALAAFLAPVDRSRVRAELDTPADAVVMIQASRLDPCKGHPVLLAALARLRAPDWVMWIAGGAQRPAERTYLDGLRQMAERLGIGARVRFLGERPDVPRLLGAADLHCQANVRPESFGVALVEALAAGLPVVTTAIGGAREIVDDTCGRLVPPEDPGALAFALDTVIADRTLRAQLAAAGPARARERADPGRQLRALHESLMHVSLQTVIV